MKKTLWLVLIIAGLLAPAQPAAAFDPGAWLTRGIMKLDTRASEIASRDAHAHKSFSSGRNHNDTVSRVRKYFTGGSKKSGKH